jgi:signal peptidase I
MPTRPAVGPASEPRVVHERRERVQAASARADALRSINRPRVSWRWLWRTLTLFQVAAVTFLVARALVVEAYKIPSTSMQGTLLAGDFLLVNKLPFGAAVPFTQLRMPAMRAPATGDVIIFAWPPDPSKTFVKRAVAVAGDTVSMVRGALVRNGRVVPEPYLRAATDSHGQAELVSPPWAGADVFGWQRAFLAGAARYYYPSRDDWGPLVVPPRHLFVLGDNRANSLDSRYWGFVPDSLLRGTPLAVYYSYTPDSASAAPWVTRVRWHRIGRRVE